MNFIFSPVKSKSIMGGVKNGYTIYNIILNRSGCAIEYLKLATAIPHTLYVRAEEAIYVTCLLNVIGYGIYTFVPCTR